MILRLFNTVLLLFIAWTVALIHIDTHKGKAHAEFEDVFIQKAKAATVEDSYIAVARTVEQINDLPKGLVEAICYQESHWKHFKGAAGEIGPCQIKPTTVVKMCPSCVYSSGTFYLTKGAKGRYVEKLQHRMGMKATRVFDEQTVIKVKWFQKTYGVSVDGIVGPGTWKKLFGYEMPGSESVPQKLQNPIINIHYAGMYLSWLRAQLGTDDPMILAAAYNGGNANMTVKYMVSVNKHFQQRQ